MDLGRVSLYNQIIENPLAFSDIRERIDRKQYFSTEEFLDDFRVIVNNCYEFNSIDDPVSDKISDIFIFVVDRVKHIGE